MIKRWVLYRFLGRQFLLWLLAFLGGLAGIIFLFEIAELIRRASGRPEVGFTIILQMAAYKLPETVQRILPFVVLFAGLFTFWRLTRNQELVVARSVGVSAWQFLAPALVLTFIFSLLNITVINPIGAALNGRYKAMEAHYLERVPTLELTGAGLWLRQYDGRHHYLLHADRIELNPLTLSPLMAFIYDNNGLYQGRVDAPEAVLGQGKWQVADAWVNMERRPTEHVEQWTLDTALTFDRIQESMAPPNTISFWEMPAFVRALKSIGLPSERHQLAFQSLLAQPLLLCSMVFFAACFALRMNRRGGVTGMVLSGVLIGSFVYTLNNVVGALGVNQTLPVPLAAWAVPVIALALSNAALLHMEDG